MIDISSIGRDINVIFHTSTKDTYFSIMFIASLKNVFDTVMFEANVAIIMRFVLHLSNISPKVSSTTDSLVEKPSFKAFVESPIKRSTPFSPREAILYRLAIGPIGVRSNL